MKRERSEDMEKEDCETFAIKIESAILWGAS